MAEGGSMETRSIPGPSVEEMAHAARPITGVADDYDSLLDLIGDRRFVLIGEASHGTHEFYRERARITRRLIDDLGFSVVAVEGDWPDAYRVNRYVMGMSTDQRCRDGARGFRGFPLGCGGTRTSSASSSGSGPATRPRPTRPRWRASTGSTSTASAPPSQQSSTTSTGWTRPRPNAARRRYSCFDHVGAEGQAYGHSVVYQGAAPCENEVVAQPAGAPAQGGPLPPARRMGGRGRAVLR